jgi:hypothetical protein
VTPNDQSCRQYYVAHDLESVGLGTSEKYVTSKVTKKRIWPKETSEGNLK